MAGAVDDSTINIVVVIVIVIIIIIIIIIIIKSFCNERRFKHAYIHIVIQW